MTVSSLRGRDCGQAEREAQDAFDAGAGHDGNVGGHFDRMALMHAAADAGIFALGVFANDDPVEIIRPAALERGVDAGKNARRTHVGILIEALADFQAQTPQRDVVGNVRVAGRTEQDRVLVAKCIETVVRHHHAMCPVVVAAPAEVLELELECIRARGERFKDCSPGRDDFLADAVTGNRRDTVILHIHREPRPTRELYPRDATAPLREEWMTAEPCRRDEATRHDRAEMV